MGAPDIILVSDKVFEELAKTNGINRDWLSAI